MAIDRFTWFGLALALLGWIVLAADLTLSPFLARTGGLADAAALRSDVFTVAQTTIFSGFAVAIIGVLRAGFGALHRFFEAVLVRATAPRPAAPSAPLIKPEPAVPVPPVDLVHHAPAKAGHPHNFVILPSGAVEVETLLGTRVFASMDEAKDYIR